MPSPQRIYRNLTDAQLDDVIAAAIDRTTNGTFTSLSGQGHNSTREFVSPETMLFEANHEKQIRTRRLAPQKVYQNLNDETDTFSSL